MIRIFRHYVPKWLVLLGASEFVMLFASVYLGVSARLLEFNPADKLLVGELWSKALVYAVTMFLLLAVVGLYQRGLRDTLRGVLLRIAIAFAVGALLTATLTALVPELSIGTQGLVIAFVCSLVAVALFRVLVHRYSDLDVFKRRVLVLGTGELARQIEGLRRRSDWQDMTLVGYVHVDGEPIQVDAGRVLRTNGTLLDLAASVSAHEIVVAMDDHAENFPVHEILDCKMSGIQVRDLLSFFERVTGKINLEALSPSSLVFADGYVQAVLRSSVHRAFDVGISALFLLFAWPIMVVTAAAILMESGWGAPVLYRQTRVGRYGRPFEILKFRSMSTDAEREGSPRWATVDDDRVTRVGAFIRKTRIDELPQLVNVLRGDMSFVGPRPERPEFVADLARKIRFYDLRHRVNPGITGWAQICYPYGASERDAREKLQYDLYYIKNYSLFLDITILIQTAQVILWGKGAR